MTISWTINHLFVRNLQRDRIHFRMIISHILGFPRIGLYRDWKFALEAYWNKAIDEPALIQKGKVIRAENWRMQAEAGLALVSVNDFSWYDHILDMSQLLGVIPDRFQKRDLGFLETYFGMARGLDLVHPCEMTKWFDTNYHYIVPELSVNQVFELDPQKIVSEIKEAKDLNYNIKPVLIGPLTYLWLSKTVSSQFDKLKLLVPLLEAYSVLLKQLYRLGIEWIQMEEPILVLDLPSAWQNAFQTAYQHFAQSNEINILLTTYFGNLKDTLSWVCQLPTAGVHLDFSHDPNLVYQALPKNKILSIGIVDGRNVWRNPLRKSLQYLKFLYDKMADKLWVGTSSSLLHCPMDLSLETSLDSEFKSWLAFSVQKVQEIVLLADGLKDEAMIQNALNENDRITQTRFLKIRNQSQTIPNSMIRRHSTFANRQPQQKLVLNLPVFPTTTIGSFPQTTELRQLRKKYKESVITEEVYTQEIKHNIQQAIQKQEALDLDVLVHGEFERSDMVDYFAELLGGMAVTENGWVQSYGSRCVKPPIIYGDVFRPEAMTVKWITYAQNLTNKPIKGMLTGPVTFIRWSFLRDDIPWFEIATQIALALRDEAIDLEKNGIKIIQIDEPAFREGLPLRQRDWGDYLKKAIFCFKLASSGVKDETQIHTHMCYSEFNDIIEAIAEMDADVITIESSRSNMALLQAFHHFQYPNEIGPGVYDVHSPQIPGTEEMVAMLKKASEYIPYQKLWVNPDCGLKTRSSHEIEIALKNMVNAAKILRKEI